MLIAFFFFNFKICYKDAQIKEQIDNKKALRNTCIPSDKTKTYLFVK